MRSRRDAYGVDPSTGFDGVRATQEELADWAKANPTHPRPSVARSRCQRCGTRIWHSGMAIGSHRRSEKCRTLAAKLREATEQARQEAKA